MTTRFFIAIAAAVIAVTLTGCGFKLRGDLTLPPMTVAITGEDRALRDDLRERLNAHRRDHLSARLRENAADPKTQARGVTLIIAKSEFQRRVSGVNAAGLATGYDYIYTIDYRVTDAAGAVLQPRATIAVRRSLRYDSAQALATQTLAIEREQAFLKRDMRSEIIMQLLRRLGRIAARTP